MKGRCKNSFDVWAETVLIKMLMNNVCLFCCNDIKSMNVAIVTYHRHMHKAPVCRNDNPIVMLY